MDEVPSSPSPNSHIVQANPQIAAALAVNSPQMQSGGPNTSLPNQQPNEQQFVSPNAPIGMGGPMRMGMQPQMRPMPYPPPQMRQGGPPIGQGPPPQHFSPMGIQQQQQFQVVQPNGPPPMQMTPQRPPGVPMGMPGPSHPMGMGPPQHMQQPGAPQFQNQSPMPPPPQQQQQQPPPPQMMQHPGGPPPQPQPQQQPQQPQMAPQPPTPMPQQGMMIQSTGPLGPIMDKTKLDDLMMQVSPTTVLEESVKEILVEYADDFVTAIIDKACKMLKNREMKKIEGRDIEFILKNVYNMPVVPRSATHIFGPQSDMIDLSKEKHVPTEAHKQRLALLKKQIKKV